MCVFECVPNVNKSLQIGVNVRVCKRVCVNPSPVEVNGLGENVRVCVRVYACDPHLYEFVRVGVHQRL